MRKTIDSTLPGLDRVAPELVDEFRAALPRARRTIATRLAEALWREDIGDARGRFSGPVHAFDRVVLPPMDVDPLSLVTDPGLAAELVSAVNGLALAYARRTGQDIARRLSAVESAAPDMFAVLAALDPDERTVSLEQLATDGHNLHPCGRTRLGWDAADLMAHDLESSATAVAYLSVPADFTVGDDLGELLGLPTPPGRRVLPVHIWQLGRLRSRYPELFRAGTLRQIGPVDAARPTAALRTVLPVRAPRPGPSRYLKLSLDIQVTSTRRTISIASTRNGPTISAVLARLVDADPLGHRILLLPETAGAASPLGTGRELSTIVRDGLTGRLEPGEEPVPGSALPALDPVRGTTLLAGLVDRYAVTRAVPDRPAAALAFLTEYALLLLPPALRLAARHGIGLEAHLQNCVPTFIGGVPHRMGLRDFAGMRVHQPRLAASGIRLDLWPGSVIGTDDPAVLLAKVGYTVFQAHLGELVLRLGESHGLNPDEAWRMVRGIVDEVLAGHPDHEFYTAARMPHKALTRMRLAGTGDVYVPVHNPLHGI